jgi:hypothetical protein
MWPSAVAQHTPGSRSRDTSPRLDRSLRVRARSASRKGSGGSRARGRQCQGDGLEGPVVPAEAAQERSVAGRVVGHARSGTPLDPIVPLARRGERNAVTPVRPVLRVERLDVQIRVVHLRHRDAPRDLPVVPDRDAGDSCEGQAGPSRPSPVVRWAAYQMPGNSIPRCGSFASNWRAGGGARPAEGPCVRSPRGPLAPAGPRGTASSREHGGAVGRAKLAAFLVGADLRDPGIRALRS